MSSGIGEVVPVSVRIIVNTNSDLPYKLADAEVIFRAGSGPLNGMKLMGFGVWKRRSGEGKNVSFPSRHYSSNGDRRNFTLLRPVENGADGVQQILRDFILDAYERSLVGESS